MANKTILVVFGGRSTEHEVSCMSVQNIVKAIDKDMYDLVLVGITKDGKWLLAESEEQIQDGSWVNSAISAVLSTDAAAKEVILSDGKGYSTRKIDVAFPVLHGLYGEDGTIQGLFEIAGIPYVGCGVVASGICMDKFFTKVVVDTLGIRQAAWVPVRRHELEQMNQVIKRVEAALSYPVFVKPSNAGSSVGVSQAKNRTELEESIRNAAQFDSKVLVEETIVGREIECAILGGDTPKASGVGEILTAQDVDFYDYDAKYRDENSRTDTSPQFPDGKENEVREAAVEIFRAVDGYGLARVDFFLEQGSNAVVFNEINTMPGFTNISMYPMLWEAKGIGSKQLVDKLIQLAFTRRG